MGLPALSRPALPEEAATPQKGPSARHGVERMGNPAPPAMAAVAEAAAAAVAAPVAACLMQPYHRTLKNQMFWFEITFFEVFHAGLSSAATQSAENTLWAILAGVLT